MLHVSPGTMDWFWKASKKEKGMKGVKKILKHIEDVCYGIFTIFISCVPFLLLSCCQYIF